MNSPIIKQKKTYEVRFTKFELLHLRDLMSISLPPEGKNTVSEMLASLENRVTVESSLWQKLTNACVAVGLPTGDNAPDYIVAPSGIAPMSVFQLASEPPSGLQDDDDDDDHDDDDELEEEGSNILELFKKMKQR